MAFFRKQSEFVKGTTMKQSDKTSTNLSLFNKNWNFADETVAEEAPVTNVSIVAILACVGGVLSFSLFFSPYFLFVPVLTLFLAIVALLTIHRSQGILVGRALALVGLWLLLIPVVAVPVKDALYYKQFEIGAKSFCRLWLKTALAGDPMQVKQLSHVPHFQKNRETDPVKYWSKFLGDEMAHEEMHRFLKNDLLLTLAALGDRATYSYHKTVGTKTGRDEEEALLIYAITYPNKQGEKETFFVQINCTRTLDEDKKIAVWKGGGNAKGSLKLEENGEPTIK